MHINHNNTEGASGQPMYHLNQDAVPESILIIGAGAFGLSTILALYSSHRYDQTKIILIDPYLPSLQISDAVTVDQAPKQNPHAASIDSSRIIRPDYAIPAYAQLANKAQQKWRGGFGGKDGKLPYRESGLALTAERSGSKYVTKAEENARNLRYNVQSLEDVQDVSQLLGTGGGSGECGYVNWQSGWADAKKAMEGAMELVTEKARKRDNVTLCRGKVECLIFGGVQQDKVVGARVDNGDELRADLTIVAAGAWSGTLVDLQGRAEARGQIMAYVPVTPQEAKILCDKPVLLNLTNGMFFIPPIQDTITGEWVIKIARHGFGYTNPVSVCLGNKTLTTSLPHSDFSPIPAEGERACRGFLQKVVPWLADRPFSLTRICWYTDTPKGDFLIDYHPSCSGLFLATGGSGHGFKFLPVLGDKVLATIEGRLQGDLRSLWKWPKDVMENFQGTDDGSRGGKRGMILEEEWRKGERIGSSRL